MRTNGGDMIIEQAVADWHRYLKGQLPGGLDELLHDDCTFFSPIVFTPQQGKAITKLYLEAAAQTLPGDGPSGDIASAGSDEAGAGGSGGSSGGGFRYTKKVLDGDTAVLEFETTVDGLYVNGVDIIRCDEDGKIIEFRVMIRPLQAVNKVHAQMAAMLERMKG
ncbi:MAG: nuclear transport factor 2 family protein [Acidimicrobiales bacterium]